MVSIVIEQATRSVRTGFEARHLSMLFLTNIFRDYDALRSPLDTGGYAHGYESTQFSGRIWLGLSMRM